MKTVKLRILDEVNVVFVGLADEHLIYLYNKFAVFAPNYFFNPKFKLGQWDGKIRYFQKTGKTFLYLLDIILPHVIRSGYNVEIEDLRKTSYVQPDAITPQALAHIGHIDTGEPITLRADQVDGVNALIANGFGICLAGTGAGKTLMCAALVNAYDGHGLRSITIVPDQTLIKQTKNEYVNCGLDTGEYSGAEKTLHHKHVVSTWQALKNNPKVVNLFDMLIVDECHGLRGNVLTKIVTDHAASIPYRFGFTGTLPKDETDRTAVHVAVGPVCHTMPAEQLIADGVLSTVHIDVIQLVEDMTDEYNKFCKEESIGKPPTITQFKDGYFPDFTSEKSYLHNNVTRIEWIAQAIEVKRDMKKGNVLCLVDNIAFGRKLAALIPDAIFVNGQDVKSPTQRQIVYDMFKDQDDLVVIATVHIAGTGLNIRRIFNLFLIDIGKSFIRIIQAIGRGLRKAADKSHVSVTDICSDLKYSKRHMKQRTNFYEEARYPYKKHKLEYMTMYQHG